MSPQSQYNVDERVLLAARNNAFWCDAVCRAHDQQTQLTEHLWICKGQPPRFHSNLTTLQPGAESHVRQQKPGGFKDGFHDIEAGAWGYSMLFEASWIWMSGPSSGGTSLEWKRVESDQDLRVWETGWATGDDEALWHPRQFPPSLLADDGNCFLGGYDEDRLAAGCILNLTAPVVGVSNTFVISIDQAVLWQDIGALGQIYYPECDLVGYERGPDLEAALAAGFQNIGPLRVWVR